MAVRSPEVIASINAANKVLARKKKELAKLGLKSNQIRNNVEVKQPSEFRTRKQAESYLRKVETFKSENRWVKNKYGVIINRKDISTINKTITDNNRLKRNFKKGIEDKPTLSGGKETKVTTRQALSTTLYDQKGGSLKETKKVTIDSFSSNYQVQHRMEGVKNRNAELKKEFSRSKGTGKTGLKKQDQSKFMQNYLKALKHQLDEGEISKKDYYEMRRLIRGMTNKQFSEWFYREEGTESVFLYSMDEMDVLLQQQQNQSLIESLINFMGG